MRISGLMASLGISEDEKGKFAVEDSSIHEKVDGIEGKLDLLESRVEKLLDSLNKLNDEESRIVLKQATLKSLADLGVDVALLGDSNRVYTVAGLIDRSDLDVLEDTIKDRTKETGMILKEELKGLRNEVPVVVISPSEYRADVITILAGLRFEKFEVATEDYTDDALERIETELERIEDSRTQALSQLKLFEQENKAWLVAMKEDLEIEKTIAHAESLMGKTRRVHVLDGWVPAKHLRDVGKRFADITGGATVIRAFDPEPGEDVPVVLENPSIIKPFESITLNFGLPSYNEIDPTLFLAISFPLIFGMMFGDIGHGAVVALFGHYLWKGRRDVTSIDIGRILFTCGLVSVLFGFLYGSFFGVEDVIHPVWTSPIHQVKEGMAKNLIGIALFVGVLQMSLGIVIDAVNRSYTHGFGDTFTGSLGRILLFFGVVTLITKLFGFPIPVFTLLAVLSSKIIGVVGILLPFTLITAEELMHTISNNPKKSELLAAAGHGLFEAADTTIMFLSNTISYARILILVLIHAMVSEVIYTIGELLKAAPYIGLMIYYLFIIGATVILILGLEGLVVYIHTIRLHFYEWFTKFYRAGGTQYMPLKIERIHTIKKRRGEVDYGSD